MTAGLEKHTCRVQINKDRLSELWIFSDVELVVETGQVPKIELGVGKLKNATAECGHRTIKFD